MFKLLAALFMLIDHMAYIFQPFLTEEIYLLGRIIGRLAFPMFAYALARGYNRTSNVFYYFLRMSIFAVVTQVLFSFTTHRLGLMQYSFMNVLITFSFGIALLAAIDLVEKSSLDMMLLMKPVYSEGEEQKVFNPGGIRLPSWVGTLIGIGMIILILWLTIRINPDYDLFGLITIVIFQRIDRSQPTYERSLRKDLKVRRYLLLFAAYAALNLLFSIGNVRNYGNTIYSWLEAFSVFGVLFFPIYDNAKKPGNFVRYFFYGFYPVHYVLLLFIFHTVR